MKIGPLGKKLERLRPAFAKAAQEVYDAWEQDEEGLSCDFGAGGICDQISQALGGVVAELTDQDVQTTDGGAMGDDHAWLVVYNKTEIYEVDIPPSVYESGRGYSWTKHPDVKFSPHDIVINPMDRSQFRDEDLEREGY